MSITEKTNAPRPAIPVDPLPLPGDSLREERDRLFDEKVLPAILSIAAFVMLALYEWYRYKFQVLPTFYFALFLTVLAAIVTAIQIYRVRHLMRRVGAVNRGLRGEVHVGNYLVDKCVPLGYRILNDLRAKQFNVDHILIGPGGIFTIETKNRTKPVEHARLAYDGRTLCKPGDKPDPEAVNQAKANADFVRGLVAKLTGRDKGKLFVRPVLLVPGWWIDGASRGREVWVFWDETLHTFLPWEDRRLSEADAALYFESLATYIRNFKK